ncbi:MAG: hypothetical protein R3284_03215 [Rubricoccaceae bacterium]|nr:hypothetical protein [Rubricoccaceae bacterium]
MHLRRLKALSIGFSFVLGTFALLAGCDSVTADGVTGTWIGTAEFQVDSILAEHNMRIMAEYETEFTFTIVDDGGLITGTVVADFSGMRIAQEAGQPADTLHFGDGVEFTNDLFGTYIDPELEMDVPDGPYEANLWTFEIIGGRGELNEFLTHTHTITRADSTEFTIELKSDEFFEIRREN